MKALIISIAFLLLAISANAQINKSDPKLKKQDDFSIVNGTAQRIMSTIKGTITYPKSLGGISSFEMKVKSALKLYSYKIINGQLQEKSPLKITEVKVLNATRADGTNYIYSFEVKAIMPYNQPLEIEIPADWPLPSGKHFFISKTNPNQYAYISESSRTYTGFFFIGTADWHPH